MFKMEARLDPSLIRKVYIILWTDTFNDLIKLRELINITIFFK